MSTDQPSRQTTSEVVNPRMEIGNESFSGSQIESAQIHTHSDDRSEFTSASVTLNPPFQGRWDYRAEVRIYEDDERVLTGLCSAARFGEEGKLHLQVRGPLWQMERTILQGFGPFGMSAKEALYWLSAVANPTVSTIVEGLQLDQTRRPFMFAIPLKNLRSTGAGIRLTTDTGIASHEYETVFKPILEQLKVMEEEPAWHEENPKLFGVVFAENFLRADQAARDRAEMTVGIINLALRTGMSHFDTRYAHGPISFSAETTLTPVALHPWIIIREASQAKGWIRQIPTAKLQAEASLDDSLERIRFFLSEFATATESGDMHDQLGRRQLSARERRLAQGTNRALRWLNIAASEEDVRDRFTASWIALESILNAIVYPGVFDGERATLQEEIRNQIGKVDLPRATRESLAITTDMLEGRLLQNDWSLSRKLNIFAEALGLKLEPRDKSLVRKLSRARNTILHGENVNPNVSQEQIDQLQHLVERLVVGVSVGGYEDLEDCVHRFHIGKIGPEGGAAPISIDGKEDVPYKMHAFRDNKGQLVGEWIAEGKIYSEKNMEIV